MKITLTIPANKISRIVKAFKTHFGETELTDGAFIKEKLVNFVKQIVAAKESEQAQKAAEVERDDSLLS